MIGKIIKIWVLGISVLFFTLATLNFQILIKYAFELEYFSDFAQAIYFYIISPLVIGSFLFIIFLLKTALHDNMKLHENNEELHENRND